MSDNVKLIKQLLDYIENYEEEVGNHDLKQFSIYLKDRVVSGGSEVQQSTYLKESYEDYRNFKEVEFSTLLTGLYRFAKHYLKKAFLNTSFNTIDEFGFLATLLRERSLLKNELINKHLLEISSGSEILKRLIKKKLVYEYPDEHDRRAKRVSLTKEGIKQIMAAFDDMHKVSEIIIGNLTDHELTDALAIFNKLTYFHQHIHQEDRNASLYQVHEKYVHDVS